MLQKVPFLNLRKEALKKFSCKEKRQTNLLSTMTNLCTRGCAPCKPDNFLILSHKIENHNNFVTTFLFSNILATIFM